MSSTTENDTMSQLCANLVGALGIQHVRTKKRLEKLYERCVVASLPNDARGAAGITAFDTLVRDLIKHIEVGWPSTTKSEVRKTLMSARNTDHNAQNDLVDSLMDKAIDAALCLWLGLDCVDETHLGVIFWPETETVQQFVLRRRFDVAIEADPRDHVRFFPPEFRAAYLKEISGIRIEQTL